jgi:hypothetical protein
MLGREGSKSRESQETCLESQNYFGFRVKGWKCTKQRLLSYTNLGLHLSHSFKNDDAYRYFF